MEDRRKHTRTDINEPAYVSAGGSVMSCIVRNISAEGAAIEVENPAFVPPQFRLVVAKDSSVYECRVAWIQLNRIGVTFISAAQGWRPPAKEESRPPRDRCCKANRIVKQAHGPATGASKAGSLNPTGARVHARSHHTKRDHQSNAAK
jgi:hypothetical protein